MGLDLVFLLERTGADFPPSTLLQSPVHLPPNNDDDWQTNHPINNHQQNFPPMASPKIASNDYRIPDMPLTSIGNLMYEDT